MAHKIIRLTAKQRAELRRAAITTAGVITWVNANVPEAVGNLWSYEEGKGQIVIVERLRKKIA